MLCLCNQCFKNSNNENEQPLLEKETLLREDAAYENGLPKEKNLNDKRNNELPIEKKKKESYQITGLIYFFF